MAVYYKMRQILLENVTKVYYKMRQFFVTKCYSFITNCDNFVTKCDSYYKMRRLLPIATVQTYLPVKYLYIY